MTALEYSEEKKYRLLQCIQLGYSSLLPLDVCLLKSRFCLCRDLGSDSIDIDRCEV